MDFKIREIQNYFSSYLNASFIESELYYVIHGLQCRIILIGIITYIQLVRIYYRENLTKILLLKSFFLLLPDSKLAEILKTTTNGEHDKNQCAPVTF